MSFEEDIKNKIKEEVAKNTGVSEKEKEFQAAALEKMFIEGILPQKALGFSDAMMAFIYSQAYRLYDSGNYQKASLYFTFLNDLNPQDARYMTGFAACKVKLNELEEAIVAYHVVTMLDKGSPFPYYYLGNLYRKIGKLNAAYAYYAIAMEKCHQIPELSKLKERAKLNLEALEREGVVK